MHALCNIIATNDGHGRAFVAAIGHATAIPIAAAIYDVHDRAFVAAIGHAAAIAVAAAMTGAAASSEPAKPTSARAPRQVGPLAPHLNA